MTHNNKVVILRSPKGDEESKKKILRFAQDDKIWS